jgi:hypothetical protein
MESNVRASWTRRAMKAGEEVARAACQAARTVPLR